MEVVDRFEAEALTNAIGHSAAATSEFFEYAFRNGVHTVLGYDDFADYVRERIGARVRIAADARIALAQRWKKERGYSNRQIAALLGVDHETVNRDARGANAPAHGAVEGKSQVDGGAFAPHVGRNRGDDAWYSPADLVAAAVEVLGGIDLDPASSSDANALIGAARYYTIEQDGLREPWSGRVWMNPPYRQPAIARFCTRLAREYADGRVEAAIALVNNATETAWFQALAAEAAAVCFPRGRVRFWHPAKAHPAPLQGQALVYLGHEPARFWYRFRAFGVVFELVAAGGEG